MRNSSKGHLWRCHFYLLYCTFFHWYKLICLNCFCVCACIFCMQQLGGRIIPFVLFCDHLCWIVSSYWKIKRLVSLQCVFGRSLSALLRLRAHDHLCLGKTSFGLKWGWGLGAFQHGFLHGRHFPLWYTGRPWISICTFYFPNGIILWEEQFLL